MRFDPPGTFKKKKANLMLSKTISFKSVANHFKSIFGRRNQKAKYKSLAKLLLLEILENRVVPAAPLNILLSKSTIAENAGINALVGRLTTEDTDLGDSFTYSFQTGPSFSDNSSFIISGSELRAATNFNSKTKDKYIIRLRSTDQLGLHVEKVFVITINAPTGSFNTIQDTGPSMNRVDIVFAGDGYTSQDIGNGVYDFHTQDYLNYIFTNTGTVDPFPRYKNFFNAHRVNVTSNQSGADKPLDGIFVDTALDASYGDDVNNPERALFFNPAKADSLVSRELAGAGFSPEMKMSPVNDDKYGGAANYGGWAVYAAANSIGTRIALHEAGHAFSSLADEYFDTGSGTFNGTDPWEVNVTSDPTGAKWARWLGYNQPDMGIVGVYEGGRYFEKGVYRPTNDSRMRSSSEISFNVVSREKIILDIYSHVDPLDGWLANSKPLLDPEYLWVDRIDESIIQMEWRVDGKLVPNANGSDFDLTDFGFGPGTYSITARAFDPTGFDLVDGWVRTNNSELEEIISWQVVNTRPSKFAPVVIMQPSGSTVIEGDQAIFTANAAGVPTPSVQWQVSTDGTNWLNISGADSTTFTTARTAASDSGKMYRAVFTNSKGTATTTPATLTVKFPPRLVSADRAAFTVDAQGTFSIMATGFPSPAFSIASGNLPVGVTLSPSGTLAGKPSPGTGGAYSLVIKASNGVLPDATQAFTLTVNQAPEITSTNQTTFTTGIFGSFSAFATGFPAPVFSIASGVLPGGITMSPSGTISGTPIPGSGGTYSFTIKAANGVNPVSVQSFILTVNQAPTFTSTNNATFTADIGGSFRVLTSGFPIAAFSIASGSLPAGVTLSPSGTLAGTPAPGTGGAYSLVIKASNGVLPDATQAFTLTVNQAPEITSTNQTTFTTGIFGSFSAFATGFPAPVFSIASGVLPGGITMSPSGTISGTPIPGSGGTYSFTIKAANGVNPVSVQSFILTVNQAPTFTSTNNATFTADIGGSFRVLTSGFPIAAFSIASGSLPAGVTLSPSGTLAGTPAPGTGGAYSLVIKASNGVLPDATQTFTLTVNQAPAIFSNNRVGFIVNKSGIHQFQATGYPSAVFSLVSGVLPGGLTLESDGRLQGIPVPGTSGPATIQVQASNSAGTFQQAFSLNIGQEGVYAVAVGGGMNQISKLDIFKNGSTELVRSFIPFPSFKGEFFVDSGDITGDGIEDLIVGSGKGSTNGHVVILDGAVLLNPNPGKAVELPYKLGGSVRASLYAFVGYSSGVAVRLADMNDDGFDDMVLAPSTGAGTRTPAHLRVWNGKDCMADFEAGKPLPYDYRWEMASFWAFGDGSNPGGGMALSVIRQYGPDLIVASQLFKGGSKVFRYDGQKALAVSQDLTGNLYLWGSGNTVVGFLVDGNQMYASAGTARITPDTVYVRNQKGEVQHRIDRIFAGSPGGLRLGLANVDEDLEEELLVVRDYDSSTRIYDIFSNKAALIDTLIPGGYSGWV